MYGFFLESAAYDVVYGVDGDEGVFVFVEYDFFELVDFEARHYAVEDFFLVSGVAALAVE